MNVETYLTIDGVECVAWIDEDGASHSMLKSVYDEQQKALDEAKII